jgi:cytidylate kinase
MTISKSLNKIITGFVFMLPILSYPNDLLSAYNVHLEKEIFYELSENFIAFPQKGESVLILIGGFQGSGKTSLIERIKKTFEFNIISTDSIRQSLFNKGIEVSPEFSKYVNNISRTLTIKSLINTNTIIDANAHSKRIQEMEKLLEAENFKQRPLKIFLNTSVEVLKNRVKNRQSIPGCYQGTEKDLESSLISSKINIEDYDLILDTDNLSKDEVYEKVENFLLNHLPKVLEAL